MQPNGYFGLCHALNLSASEVIQRTWYITSRIAKPECQEQIMEVFCAMQYDLNGQCVPSRFFDVDNDNIGLGGWTQHIYPLRGQRPQNLWEELYLRAQLKVKVVRYYFFRFNFEESQISTLKKSMKNEN